MKINFTIPVYNEHDIFKKNAERIFNFLKSSDFNFEWKLVFVINGSSDDFEKMVKLFSLKHKDYVSFLVVKEKGKGRAIKNYFKISNADILVYMDMDLAVSLDNIADLVNPVVNGDADLCFGSRMLPRSLRKRSWTRELNSKLYIFISQIILGHDFSDLQCGFKAITKNAWNSIENKIKDDFWFFDTELIFYANREKLRILEIPINWSENRYDDRKSKIKIWKDGFVFLVNMINLKFRKN